MRHAWGSLATEDTNGRSSSIHNEGFLGLRIYVVDIGINEVWTAYGEQLGLAAGTGLDFGFKWAMTLRVAQEINDEDEGDNEDDG
jgi:hypothetical protein